MMRDPRSATSVWRSAGPAGPQAASTASTVSGRTMRAPSGGERDLAAAGVVLAGVALRPASGDELVDEPAHRRLAQGEVVDQVGLRERPRSAGTHRAWASDTGTGDPHGVSSGWC